MSHVNQNAYFVEPGFTKEGLDQHRGVGAGNSCLAEQNEKKQSAFPRVTQESGNEEER